MSLFIRLEIDPTVCLGIEKCGKCIQVCPVNIFSAHGNYPEAVEDNEDECTLLDLCLQACEPNGITMRQLYEET